MRVVGVFGYIGDVIFRVGCDNENWPCLLAKYGRPIARLKQNANIHQLAGLNVPEETSKTGIRRIVDMEPLLLRWLDYTFAQAAESTAPSSRRRIFVRGSEQSALLPGSSAGPKTHRGEPMPLIGWLRIMM